MSRKFEKSYCFPSQLSLVDLLRRFYSLGICRATLNHYLSFLEAEGYIQRIKRIKRLPSGALRFASTIYILTNKAYKVLHRLGHSLYSAGVRIFSRASAIVYDRSPGVKIRRWDPPPEIPPSVKEALSKILS